MTNVRSRLFSIHSNDGSSLEITLLWFFWYSLRKTNPLKKLDWNWLTNRILIERVRHCLGPPLHWGSKGNWHYPIVICLVLTSYGEPQLSANYSSITCVPVVITHCSPSFIEADLHSPLIGHWTSYQPEITITADYDTKLCHINFILCIVNTICLLLVGLQRTLASS